MTAGKVRLFLTLTLLELESLIYFLKFTKTFNNRSEKFNLRVKFIAEKVIT